DPLRRRHLRQRPSLSSAYPSARRLSAWQSRQQTPGPDHARAKDLTGLEPFPFRLNRNGGSISLSDAFSSREPVSTSVENALTRCPNRFVSDHPVDRAFVIAQSAQHLAGMLADTRRRSADDRLVDGKSRRGLRLPHASDRRLVELDDEAARHHLLVVEDLAAAQDR